MNDKKLYQIMIKNHSIMIKRMIDRKIISRNADGILHVVQETKVEPNKPNFDFASLKREGDFIHIPMYYEDVLNTNLFFGIELTRKVEKHETSIHNYYKNIDVTYRDILEAGIELFEAGGSSITVDHPYCKLTDLDYVLKNHSEEIIWIELPKDIRIPNKHLTTYIASLNRQINIIKERKYPRAISGYVTEYEGHEWGGPNHYLESSINQRGIFAYKPIYCDINWDWSFVEDNKNVINWKLLVEESNLVWNEDRVREYIEYIPFYIKNADSYCEKYKETDTIRDYSRFGLLSNEFINEFKDYLDWRILLKTGQFVWSPAELKAFYKYASSIEIPWNRSSRRILAGSQIGIGWLFDNKHFSWSPELFKTAVELDNSLLSLCYRNVFFKNLLFKIDNYKKFVSSINKEEDFWLKLKDGDKVKGRAYSAFFTIDNIRINKSKWEEIIKEELIHVRRTPDTNYHYYMAYTMWDYYISNKAIKLSYEMCKYLAQLSIKIGGLYILEDGYYLSQDNRHPTLNALEAFEIHDFENDHEIEQIIDDNFLFEFFMNIPNNYILDFLINRFFSDYDVAEFLSVINNYVKIDPIKE